MKKIVIKLACITMVLGTLIGNTRVCATNLNEQKQVKVESKITENIQPKEYTEEYKAYLELSSEEKAQIKVIPRMYKVPFETLYEGQVYKIEAPMPGKFDLRDKIEIQVENQEEYGNCWAFAGIKAIETNLALKDIKMDLSELHLDYMTSTIFGGNRELHVTGGNFDSVFLGYLANNYGPVFEKEVPYDADYNIDEYDYLYELEPKAYVNETELFPSIDKLLNEYTDEELELFKSKVKNHLATNGSISATIYTPDDGTTYFNSDTYALYSTKDDEWTPGRELHAVSIIGWDDNYSRYNFNEDNMPEKDGAYIALNSWGEYWGDNGVFYISYEDYYVGKELAGVVDASLSPKCEQIQFNDEKLYNAIKEELGRMVISCNDENKTLNVTKVVLQNFKNIIEMDLSNKEITDLTGIEYFKEISILNLSNNKISDISLLANLEELIELDLSNNNITDVKSIENLGKYNEEFVWKELNLKLSGNKGLTNLDKLINVAELELDNCNLTNTDLLKLKELNVSSLSIRDNNITDVNELKNLENLYRLDLSGNKNINLNTIPDRISNLALNSCNISNFEALVEVFKDQYLCELDLSNNPINNTQLEKITEIDVAILNLSDTNITDVSVLENENVEVLFFDNNTLPTGIEKLTNLYAISLKNCNLDNVEIFSRFERLSELYLSNNNISNIESLADCTNLSVLELGNNNISNIECIKNMPGLYQLGLENNNIENIDELLNLDIRLSCLNISGNNINVMELPNGTIEQLYNLGKYINGKLNQTEEMEIELQINEDNEIEISEIFYMSYVNRYKNKVKIECENCTINFHNRIMVVHPVNYTEDIASVKIIGGIFDGTAYNVNYTPKDVIEITGIGIDGDDKFVEGDEFVFSGKVYCEYENGLKKEIKDYSLLEFENVNSTVEKGETTVKVKYLDYEKEYNIYTYGKDEAISVILVDKQLYESIKEQIVYITEFLYTNDKLNKMILPKEGVNNITYMYIKESVTDITGISKLFNISDIYIHDAKITDISEIEKLKDLQSITLYDVKNVDIFKTIFEREKMKSIVIYSTMEEKELKKADGKIILPEYIQEITNKDEKLKATARCYYVDEKDIAYFEKTKPMQVEKNAEGKLVTQLNREISEDMPAGKRCADIIFEGEESKYYMICTIKYNTSEVVQGEVESVKYKVDKENYIISKVIPNSKVSEFIQNINTTDEIRIRNKNNEVLLENDNVATGDILEIVGSTEQYTISVLGDLDGDACITTNDLAKMKLHLIKKVELENEYLKAAKLDENEDEDTEVSVNDLAKIKLILIQMLVLQ